MMERFKSELALARLTVFEAMIQGWLSFLTGLLAVYLLADGHWWLAIVPVLACPLGVFSMCVRVIEAGMYYRRANR